MQYQIKEFEELDSTNSEASRGGYHHGDLIIAQWQSQGRGQRGNKWISRKGDNLMFTLVIEPKDITVYQQFRVSLLASVAAADALESLGIECRLKWPNDLYVGDKKIGGILIEHHSMGEQISRSIIGIGININQKEFDPTLPNPTSIANCGCTEVTSSDVLGAFQKAFSQRYEQTTEKLSEHYSQILWRGKDFHPFKDQEGEFRAKIVGINSNTGELTLETEGGQQRSYYFKEVEFIL